MVIETPASVIFSGVRQVFFVTFALIGFLIIMLIVILIDRYKIRTASFCNWQSIEHAVIGNIVPDFPLINKSLNLSYAGTDL